MSHWVCMYITVEKWQLSKCRVGAQWNPSYRSLLSFAYTKELIQIEDVVSFVDSGFCSPLSLSLFRHSSPFRIMWETVARACEMVEVDPEDVGRERRLSRPN